MARHQSWEGEAAAGLTMAVLLLAVLVAIGAWKVTEMTLKEIGRIYLDHGGRGSTARLLWYALVALVAMWLLCGIVALAVPTAAAPCAYLAAWAFLTYVLSIEIVDWKARRGQPRPGDPRSLDTYLSGLGISSSEPLEASNGHRRSVTAD